MEEPAQKQRVPTMKRHPRINISSAASSWRLWTDGRTSRETEVEKLPAKWKNRPGRGNCKEPATNGEEKKWILRWKPLPLHEFAPADRIGSEGDMEFQTGYYSRNYAPGSSLPEYPGRWEEFGNCAADLYLLSPSPICPPLPPVSP